MDEMKEMTDLTPETTDQAPVEAVVAEEIASEAAPNPTVKPEKKNKKLKTLIIGLAIVLALLLVAAFWVLPAMNNEAVVEPTVPETTVPQETEALASTEPVTEVTTEATESTEPTEPIDERLESLKELNAKNPDAVAWLQIEGTVVDYPVMFTPDDGEKYLYANTEGKFDAGGCLLIDEHCSMDPRSDNLIIHGHNMKRGTMFATIPKYRSKDFWKKHPIIRFTTLEGTHEYEIIAAFYDRVYYKSEKVFKYYKFIDAEDRADYKNAISQFKKKALYDTGVNAKYGDNLLTLSTCVYHVEDGRFVVVAKQTK